METPDEPLVPDGVRIRLPDFRLPEFQGLGLGIALIVAAIVAGVALFKFLPSPILSLSDRGIFPRNLLVWTLAFAAYVLIADVLPQIIALVMLWVAFVRADARDRYLWSAIMIVSSSQVAYLLDMVVQVPAHRFIRWEPMEFIHTPMVSGLIAYGALHFALAREERKRMLAPIAVVAVALLVLFPTAIGVASWATSLCSLLVAMGLWAIGVWIAERVGFDVYASAEAPVET